MSLFQQKCQFPSHQHPGFAKDQDQPHGLSAPQPFWRHFVKKAAFSLSPHIPFFAPVPTSMLSVRHTCSYTTPASDNLRTSVCTQVEDVLPVPFLWNILTFFFHFSSSFYHELCYFWSAFALGPYCFTTMCMHSKPCELKQLHTVCAGMRLYLVCCIFFNHSAILSQEGWGS